jgi:hypothetical protein
MTTLSSFSYQSSLFDNQYEFSSILERDYNKIKSITSKVKNTLRTKKKKVK